MKNFDTHTAPLLTLIPSAGTRIEECVIEATILALTERRNVSFAFNDTPILIEWAKVVKPTLDGWSRGRGEL